jgi:hypothetical protein
MKVPVREPAAVEAAPMPVESGRHDERVRVLDGMVKRLRTFIAELQEEVKAKEYEIHRLQARLRNGRTARDAELAKDTEVVKKDAVIQSLKKRLHKEERYNRNLVKRLARIKKFAELSMEGEVVPVKVMDALTKDGLRKLIDDVGIDEGDLIFVTRTDGWGRNIVRDLAELRVKAVIIASEVLAASDPQMLPLFREAGVPLLSDKHSGGQGRGKQGLAGKGSLESSLREWQGQQEQHEREKKSEMIEHIFKEYKSERGNEVRKGG